jgi:YfiH family protein
MIESIPGRAGEQPLRVVRSSLFGAFPGLAFGLSTRAGGASRPPYDLNLSFRVGDDEDAVRLNRRRFFGALGLGEESLAIPQQVHGDTVRVALAPGAYPDCDGLVSDREGVYLVISVADCVPVFAYDAVRGAVGAFHAGWRGSKLAIVARGIALMRAQFGSAPQNIRAVIGQSAGPCCYEVGEEVAADFDERFVLRKPGERPRLDLHGLNRDLLLSSGVPPGQIELLASCTICHPEEFHSYRRDRDLSGRMMGVIGRRPTAPETAR